MKRIPLILFIFALILSCKKEFADPTGPNHNVVVFAKGANCGDSYMLKFDSNITDLPNNYQDFLYNEINLPDSLKVTGKELQVTYRLPTSGEAIDCQESLINYPQIFILTAVE
jgi:hypothetical protein